MVGSELKSGRESEGVYIKSYIGIYLREALPTIGTKTFDLNAKKSVDAL